MPVGILSTASCFCLFGKIRQAGAGKPAVRMLSERRCRTEPKLPASPVSVAGRCAADPVGKVFHGQWFADVEPLRRITAEVIQHIPGHALCLNQGRQPHNQPAHCHAWRARGHNVP